MTISEDRIEDVFDWRVAPGAVEVVVVRWEDVLDQAVEPSAFASLVARLSTAGVDVVLAVPLEVEEAARGLAARATGAGRLILWAGDGVVSEFGEAPFVPAGGHPVGWARRWLSGPSAPHAVVELLGQPLVEALEAIASAHEGFPAPTPDDSWRLDVEGFSSGRERDVESWMTVANGRTGTRGALEERTVGSAPATYVAGVYGCPDERDAVPELVRGPEWTHLSPRTGRERVELFEGVMFDHCRTLDLRQGLVLRRWRQGLPWGAAWTFRSARMASQADRAVAALEAEASADESPVTLAGDVLLPTGSSAIEAAEAVEDGDDLLVTVRPRNKPAVFFAVATEEAGGRLQRIVTADRVAPDGARAALREARAVGLAGLRARHRRAWRDRWRDADVVIPGDLDLQRKMRFSLYHLISSGDPESDVASVGARGLTGPGYGGRVFWDTEVFLLPFYIWTHPPTARALLAYRHRTLAAAKAKARSYGYPGALYAWESADTGEEATPAFGWLPDGTRLEILTGLQEHHISADVAWAAWQYWHATGDASFLFEMGAEMIVETARFWAGRTEQDADGRHHIRGVIGPDEYHEGVDDNAFTNAMARWNLRIAAHLCELLPDLDGSAWPDLRSRLALDASEPGQWRERAARLHDGFDADTRRYEQFDGFYRLEELRAVDLAPRPFGAETRLGIPRLRASQVIKQADVVMLAHMLPDEVPADVARVNYDFYEPRTSHGSSLSPAIHAAVAARLGLLDDADRYFRMAAAIDLNDRMGNAEHGVHVATMGGLWQAAVFGFGGVRADGDALRIDPRLPASWPGLAFPVQWRGARLHVEVRADEASADEVRADEASADEVTIDLDAPVRLAFGTGPPAPVGPGTFVAHRSGDRWSPLEPTERYALT